jgi:UDP-N-acetylmuramyl pentapeptide phosphotransferase/UDP-N-acetylglucosamine-1-phosphate transferase
MTNLYNFMDGSDGLAGGMTVSGFACYAMIAFLAGHIELGVASACVASGALAFLLFNFHPARIFMGDSGSIPLGFLAAAFGLVGWQQGIWPISVPLIAFSPFIADATVTLVRRIAAGDIIWKPHRDHYYQRLIRMGHSHRQTALMEYALMASTSCSAIAVVALPGGWQAAAIAGWIIIYILLASSIDRSWKQHLEQT